MLITAKIKHIDLNSINVDKDVGSLANFFNSIILFTAIGIITLYIINFLKRIGKKDYQQWLLEGEYAGKVYSAKRWYKVSKMVRNIKYPRSERKLLADTEPTNTIDFIKYLNFDLLFPFFDSHKFLKVRSKTVIFIWLLAVGIIKTSNNAYSLLDCVIVMVLASVLAYDTNRIAIAGALHLSCINTIIRMAYIVGYIPKYRSLQNWAKDGLLLIEEEKQPIPEIEPEPLPKPEPEPKAKINNIHLRQILPFMERLPIKQTESKNSLQHDLNKCLKHIGLLKQNSGGKMPELKVIDSKSTFGANIITIDVTTVQGLTLNKLDSRKSEIESFINWDGVRFERGQASGTVNIIVPHEERQRILLRDMLEDPEFLKIPSQNFPIPIGKTLEGKAVYAELSNPITPHFLIGGGTGSGKSFLVNCILLSLLNAYAPDEFLLFIIDPKGSEFTNFKPFPHVLNYVDNTFSKQLDLVKWAENEMNRRNTELFAPAGIRNFAQWNERNSGESLPRILIVIDEYADIVTDKEQRKEFEPVVMRLAAKARSAGIHLMLIMQKPNTETVNSTLRSNLGCRIALRMTDTNSYRTILNDYDNTTLAGRGDMLVEFSDKKYRLQGACMTTGSEDEEEILIKKILKYWDNWNGNDKKLRMEPDTDPKQDPQKALSEVAATKDPFNEIEQKLIAYFADYAYSMDNREFGEDEKEMPVVIPKSRTELREIMACGKGSLQAALLNLEQNEFIKTEGSNKGAKIYFLPSEVECFDLLKKYEPEALKKYS